MTTRDFWEWPPRPDGSSPSPGDVAYVHVQGVAADEWVIDHPLGFFPAVTLENSAGEVVEADLEYPTVATVTVRFGGPVSGRAYLS